MPCRITVFLVFVMGNFLVFGDRTKYVKLEAGVGAALLGLSIIGIAALFAIYCFCCCHRFCCKKQEKDGSTNGGASHKQQRKGYLSSSCKKQDKETSNQSNSSEKQRSGKTRCECCWEKICDYIRSVKYFHRLLGYVFSNISELYIEHETTTKAGDTKVLIVSERKIPSGYIEWSTYLYYIFMLLMCFMWFIAIALELSIYRKTGTCNDINVNVNSFRCFAVYNNYHLIDCKNATNDIKVICYLYHLNIVGFGVAFSAAKFISIVGDIAFKIILKGTNQCNATCFGVMRIAGMIIGSGGLGVFLWAIITRKWDEEYFIYAEIPMRLTQLILLCATGLGILLLPPWIKYSKNGLSHKVSSHGL